MHWRVDIAPDGGTPVTAAQSPDLPYPEVVSGDGYVGDSKQAWERASVPFTAGTGTTAALVLYGDPSFVGGGTHRVMAVDDVKVECIKE